MTNLENELLDLLEKERAENVQQYEILTTNLLKAQRQQNAHIFLQIKRTNQHLDSIERAFTMLTKNLGKEKTKTDDKDILQILENGFGQLLQHFKDSSEATNKLLQEYLKKQNMKQSEIETMLYEEDEY